MKTISQSRVLLGCTASLSLMAVSVSAAALDLNVAGTKASLYGYAELNVIYDKDANLGPLFTPGAIALDSDSSSEGTFRQMPMSLALVCPP